MRQRHLHRQAATLLAVMIMVVADAPAETAVGKRANGSSGIGYASVAAARSALTALPRAEVRVDDGWTVITDGAVGPQTTWTFAPPAHPAYPVLIRRDAVMKQGQPTLVTHFLCEGRRAACETLYTNLKNAD